MDKGLPAQIPHNKQHKNNKKAASSIEQDRAHLPPSGHGAVEVQHIVAMPFFEDTEQK